MTGTGDPTLHCRDEVVCSGRSITYSTAFASYQCGGRGLSEQVGEREVTPLREKIKTPPIPTLGDWQDGLAIKVIVVQT